jgi:hypothetical protein
MLFLRENFEDGKCPTGLLQSRTLKFYSYPELFLIFNVKPIEKYLAFEPWTENKYQLHSKGKLTTPRRENRKIRHETNVSIRCRNLRSIEWYQKHLCKSRKTILLRT